MSVPTYPAYQDSGVEWLGTLPSGWAVKRVKHVTRSIEQGWSPQCDGFPVASAKKWGVLKVGCVNGGRFDPEENKALPAELAPMPELGISAGDVLISRANTRELVGGAVCVSAGHPNLLLCDKLYRLRLNDAVCLPQWLAVYLRSDAARGQIELAASGASQSMVNIGQGTILDLPMPLPKREEQFQILAFLDRETGKIDALVAEQERLIALLKEKRQAVISQAVTKGLDASAPMTDSGVAWLGQVPAHWEVKRLKHLVRPGTSISYGIVQPGDAQDEGVPFIQTTNMTSASFGPDALQKTTPEIAAAYPRTCLEGGEVVLGIRASIGACHVVPQALRGVNLSRGVARIVSDGTVSSEFLAAFLRSKSATEYWGLMRQGSTFNEVSIETVREISIPRPTLAEQETIIRFVTTAAAILGTLTTEAHHAITLLRERRAALISAAVTGKIDVRGLAPSPGSGSMTAAIGRSLELYYIDGHPDGMLTAELFNWTGHVLMAPRTQILMALDRQEASYAGIYLLIGERDGKPLAYIGEGEDMRHRIRAHDVSRDWWTSAVLVTAAANKLNKAHVRYLEARLIASARAIERIPLENATNPTLPSLSEADIAKMEAFLENLLVVLPAVRVDMFIQRSRPAGALTPKPPGAVAGPSVVGRFVLNVAKHNLHANATQTGGEFIVEAGSQARREWAGIRSEATSYAQLHGELQRSGVLVVEGANSRFTQNYAFRSPSAAAAVVTGRPANGQVEWKEVGTGSTYKAWEARQLAMRSTDQP